MTSKINVGPVPVVNLHSKPPKIEIVNVSSNSYHFDALPEFLAGFKIKKQHGILIYSMEFLNQETMVALSTNLGQTVLINMNDLTIHSIMDISYPTYIWRSLAHGNLLLRNFLIGSEKSTLEIVDFQSNMVVDQHELNELCSALLLHQDQVLASTRQGKVVSFSLNDFKIKRIVAPSEQSLQHSRSYSCIFACRNGIHLVLGSYTKDLTFIDQDTFLEVYTVEIPEGIWSIVEYDENCFYCGGNSGNLYHVQDRKVVMTYTLQNNRISSLIYRANFLYSFSLDGSFVIFDTRQMKLSRSSKLVT